MLAFTPRVDLSLPVGTNGGSPYFLTAADIDGDGRLDLIACEVSGSRVSIFRNTATAGSLTTNSFAPPVSFSVGADCRYALAADVDGDGRVDIIAANFGNNTLSILKNTGSPGSLSFAPQVVLPTLAAPNALAVGDLDGDGKLDVAVANSSASFVSVFRNTSTSGVIDTNSFAPRVDLSAPSGSWTTIQAGDVDGDGKADLILGSYNGQSISVFRNLSPSPGSLSFAPHVDFAGGSHFHAVSLGDFNGDGKPDIAAVGESPNQMSVFQNVSTPGSFTNASLAGRVDFSAGSDPSGVAVGDLDGDGRPDVVFANFYDNTLSIYRNIAPFAAPPTITTQPTNQTAFVGGNATFSVTAGGTTPLSYQWSFNTTNLLGATNATLTLTNLQFAQAGVYAVLVTNNYGSILSSNATLTVNDKLDHFVWGQIPSPRFVNVPFAVVIQAQDETNGTFTNFTGTVILSSTNGISINPPISTSFVQGVWTGTVMVAQTATNLVLQDSDGHGESGLANPINVINLPPLTTAVSGGTLYVFWPVNPAGFGLETTAGLSPANWGTVTTPPFQIGDQYLLPIQMSETNAFYRLRFSGP